MTEPDQGALGWRVKSLEDQTRSLREECRRLDDKKADEDDMNKLGQKVDALDKAKADRELVADLIKRIDRQSAAIWALALAIVTAAVTFAASGGHL